MKLGRYILHDCIASGGMASVHLARMIGPAGFTRTVAIKRLHPHLARDPEFARMFLDEARLACRIQHPNVASTLDVVVNDRELFLVMDYVLGPSLSHLSRILARQGESIPLGIAATIVCDALHGLHAAHEAVSESGESLSIVHRDVSPQNILVGADGCIRLVDFGIAKASSRLQSTQGGVIKGKLAYAAPEQLLQGAIDRRCDVYSAGVVFWEILARRKLFVGDDPPSLIGAVLAARIPPISSVQPSVPKELDEVLARAMAREAEDRYASAVDFASAIEAVIAPASAREVADWVSRVAGDIIAESRGTVRSVEQTPTNHHPVDAALPEIGALADVGALAELGAGGDAAKISAANTIKWKDAPKARRRLRRPAIAAGLFLVAGLFLSVAFGRNRWPRASDSALAPSSVPASSSIVDVPTTAPSTAEDAPPPATVASVRSVTSPNATSAPARHASSSPRKAPVPAASNRLRDDCRPDFTLDAKGVKRFKPWCI